MGEVKRPEGMFSKAELLIKKKKFRGKAGEPRPQENQKSSNNEGKGDAYNRLHGSKSPITGLTHESKKTIVAHGLNLGLGGRDTKIFLGGKRILERWGDRSPPERKKGLGCPALKKGW